MSLAPRSCLAVAALAGENAIALAESTAWPSAKWAKDPIGFGFHILGIEGWEFQHKILESVIHHRNTAVRAGRKVGKDYAGAWAALWWWATRRDGRVFLYGPTLKQIDEILYREMKFLWLGHGRCVRCKKDDPGGPRPCPHSALMVGKMGESCATGLKAPDMREIIGMASVAGGGMKGFSGANVLAIEDEASQMKDAIDASIVGNLAAEGTRRLMISNPDKTEGFHYRAFHTERENFGGGEGLIECSSEDSPNIKSGRELIPGLASREWLEERALAWGRGSRMWITEVEGRHPKAEEGQLFSLEAIRQAEILWKRSDYGGAGRLHLGIDVAGEGRDGDESAFAARRGLRCLGIDAERGLSADGILERILRILKRWKTTADVGDECPLVIVDRDGAVGARVYDRLLAHSQNNDGVMHVIGFRGSERPKGEMGDAYKLNRDLLYGGLLEWFREGGAIEENVWLEAELTTLRWIDAENNRQVLIRKDAIREKLQGRSPDRCLVAGTMIVTTRGNLPIEQVVPGDMTMTRRGWRAVKAAAKTAESEPVWRVETSGGRSLVGTGNHPVWTDEHGFARIDALTLGDSVTAWQPSMHAFSKEFASLGTQTRRRSQADVISIPQRARDEPPCIEQFGSKRTVRSLRLVRFTTEIAIRSTTISQISNASHARSMANGMRDNTPKPFALASTACDTLPQRGTAPRQDSRGIPSLGGNLGETPAWLNAHAVSVARRLSITPDSGADGSAVGRAHKDWHGERDIARSGRASSARGHLRPSDFARPELVLDRVLRITGQGCAAVYSLSVDDAEEYFANGILVHNCDALALSTWGERREQATMPEPVKASRDVYEDADDQARSFDPYSAGSFTGKEGKRR